MALSFPDQRAIVTGGSSGIGLAIGKLMFSGGAHVTLVARDVDRLEAARRELEQSRQRDDQELHILSIDLSDSSAACSKLQEHAARYGPPDWLINSAGAAHPGLVEELDLDIFRWMMEANYFTQLHAVKALLPSMLARGSGKIVNFSSIAGFLGVFGYTAYGAAKYAVRGFSDALRAELKPRGIKVAIVFPPDTITPQLEYENQFKPDVTKILNGNAKPMSAEAVAQHTLTEVSRGRYIILPGGEAPWLFRASNLLGSLTHRVMDRFVSDALRKTRK